MSNNAFKTILFLSVLSIAGCASYYPRVTVDPDVFEAVSKSIKKEGTYATTHGFIYSESAASGRLWTDWFSRHKGELIFKIDASVVEKEYSVSVLQKGVVIPSKKETRRSKEIKDRIIKRIEATL